MKQVTSMTFCEASARQVPVINYAVAVYRHNSGSLTGLSLSFEINIGKKILHSLSFQSADTGDSIHLKCYNK